MKYAPVLLVLAAGGLLGWFAPGLGGGNAAPAVEASPSPGPAVAPAPRPNEVVLPRAADGHFYAEVLVGSVSTRMLVDTGASVVALTREDADALGVTWDPSQLEPVAQGAGGPVYGIRVVLREVELDGLKARDVDAVVVPEGLPVSLLGQSFLSRLARMSMDPEKMVLGG